MNTNPHQNALRSRWTLEGTIPLSGVAEGAAWHRARSVATGDPVTLFVVQGETALETADAVRRAYLVEDPHLMPVREVVVLDDPREVDQSAPTDEGTSGAHPTTVVEYPLPPAPPLAALLGKGPLHPETARAVVGEAATGLEVARRRGLRHQFLDSNRVFVDTRSGEVTVLGVGVEAASHRDLDRSREVASFQDTAALTALLYRALTGHSPRPDEDGTVPRPSAVVPAGTAPIPADLDLLCDMVLNGSDEESPETTRSLIAALEPWQSIPVTLEAHRPHATTPDPSEPAAAPPASTAVPVGAAATAATDSPATAPEGDLDEGDLDGDDLDGDDLDEEDLDGDDLESTARMGAVPGEEGPDNDDPDRPQQEDPEPTEPPYDEPPSHDRQDDGQAGQDTEHTASDAQAIVRDLQLDEKRSRSAFPGDLAITVPRRPHPPGPAATSGGRGGIAVSGGAIADAPGAAAPPEVSAAPGAAAAAGTAAVAGAAAAPAAAAQAPETSIPARRSGSHWPLAPDQPGAAAEQPSDSPASASASPPASAAVYDPEPDPAGPVAEEDRTEPAAAGIQTGPIVVRGREHSALEEGPVEATQPAQRSTLFREVVNVAVDSDDPGTFAMGPSQPEQRSRQAQWILLGGVLLVILAMVFALSSITSGLRERVENPLDTDPPTTSVATEEETTQEEPTEEETTEEEETLPAAELGGVDLVAEGSDSEPDNIDQMDRITDGDPETFWSTQYYTSPQYGGLKDGIGVRIGLAEQSTLSAVTVTTARNSGGMLELRAITDGALGETLATGEFAGDGELRLEPDEPVETESVALWLSELPPDSEESGHFRGRIAEIQVE